VKFINKVTVTGADDSVTPKELMDISENFPFVEWGLLLSKSSMGNFRFPSAEWLSNFTKEVWYSEIQLSGHVCGSWVKQILKGNWINRELDNIHPHLDCIFDRFQINTHGRNHYLDAEKVVDMFNDCLVNQTVIFQYDNANNDIFGLDILGKSALFDLSGGAGVLPEHWPTPLEEAPCGYAGGLSPENVQGQIEKISKIVAPDDVIWIDAETHLRSNGDQQFDLDKVVAFLEATKPYII
jgi:hypothetical protein